MWGGEIADIVRSLCNCLVLIVGTDALHRHCPHAYVTRVLCVCVWRVSTLMPTAGCCRAVLAELSAPTPRTPSPRASGRYTMSASASASSVQTRAGSPIKPSEDPLGLGPLGESETASANWLERQPSNYRTTSPQCSHARAHHTHTHTSFIFYTTLTLCCASE
jgi:hypothetical protein